MYKKNTPLYLTERPYKLLIYNPVISRLLAVSKLYAPLPPEKKSELIQIVSETETYSDLPDWVKEYLVEVQKALKEDYKKANINQTKE